MSFVAMDLLSCRCDCDAPPRITLVGWLYKLAQSGKWDFGGAILQVNQLHRMVQDPQMSVWQVVAT